MTYRILKLTEEAIENGIDLAEAVYQGNVETVKEFNTYESCVDYFEAANYDKRVYGYG